MFLFLKRPKNPPLRTSFEFKMTASDPRSFLILRIASGIVGATYFFIFMLHSPPQHFGFAHLVQVHYRTKRPPVVKTDLIAVLNTCVSRGNTAQYVFLLLMQACPLPRESL